MEALKLMKVGDGGQRAANPASCLTMKIRSPPTRETTSWLLGTRLATKREEKPPPEAPTPKCYTPNQKA